MKHINQYKFIYLLCILFFGAADAKENLLLIDDCFTFNLDSACRPQKNAVNKAAPPRTNFIKDELVLLYPSNDTENINKIIKKYNLKTTHKLLLNSVNTGMIVSKTNGQNPINLSKSINKHERNIEAATNNTFQPAAISYQNSYSMYDTGVSYVHRTTKGKGVSICMIDTPVDIYHPSLSNSHLDTLDLIKFNPSDKETMLHGTSVAGILVSQNKHIGIAPQARLFAISAFSTTESRPFILQGTSSDIATAIDSCINHKVDVINLSFTGAKDSLIEKLVTKAINKGIIVVAAGGNGGHWGSTIYPAVINGVIAATAVDKDNKLFSQADKGRFIDFAAPGVNVLTIAPGGKYRLASGTSLSSAHISGIIALLLSEKRNGAIEKTLTDTALDLGKPGKDQEFGNGLVSARRALAEINKKARN